MEKYKDREWLREQYVQEKKSGPTIARELEIPVKTLYYWLEKFGIERRDGAESHRITSRRGKEKYKDEEWLREKYLEENMTMEEIGKLLGKSVTTIYDWIGKLGIPKKRKRDYSEGKYQDKTWLKEQYIDKDLSTYQIAEKCNCSSQTIAKWLHEFNIEVDKQPADIEDVHTKCAQCGKAIAIWPSNVADHNFCSQECYDKWRTEGNLRRKWSEAKCTYCGQIFERKTSHIQEDGPNFCSKECQDKWQAKRHLYEDDFTWIGSQVLVQCDYCGEDVKLKRSAVKEHNFCSRDCQWKWLSENNRGKDNPLWRGGRINYYGPNWREQRRQTLKRDSYTCQVCGKKMVDCDRELDVHHIIRFREFRYPLFAGNEVKNVLAEFDWKRANRLENLVSVCKSCHKLVEGDEDFFQ